MANYWYKKDKRVLRVEENSNNNKIKQLKDNGYVQVLDRRNPEDTIVAQPKPKPKAKPKKKAKKK